MFFAGCNPATPDADAGNNPDPVRGGKPGPFALRTCDGGITTWVPRSDGTRDSFIRVWARHSNEAWAVSDTNAIIRVWNGTEWRSTDAGCCGAGSIWGSGDSDVWLTVDRSVHRWTGDGWSGPLTTLSGIGHEYRGVWASGPDDVWAVGRDSLMSKLLIATHWDGTSWSEQAPDSGPRPSSSTYMLRVTGRGPTDVWSVGSHYESNGGVLSGGDRLWRWDGTRWTAQPLSDRMLGLWASPTGIWLAGPAGVLRPDGGSRPMQLTPGPAVARAIAGTAEDDVWAVGATDLLGTSRAGIIFHWDGSQWSKLPYSGPALNDVFALSRCEAWAVGEEGQIVHLE